jgi:type II secretory pathway pseudopilin PulG
LELLEDKKLKNHGFVNSVVMEGMIVAAIVGVILAIVIPQYSAHKNRGYDREAITNANHAYEASQAFFRTKPKGAATIEEISNYGYKWSPDILVTIEGGKENLSIMARHVKSDQYYKINEKGELSKATAY